MTGAVHRCGVCGDCACYVRGRLTLCSTCADHVLPWLIGSARTGYTPSTTTTTPVPTAPAAKAARWRR